MKTKIVPIVMGALGTVPLRLKGNYKDIGSLHCWISKDANKSNVKVRKEKHFGIGNLLVLGTMILALAIKPRLN